MSSTSSHYGASAEDAHRILEQIEQQFRLGKDDLMRITSKFLEDFELGLSEYNQPMAMMYAGFVCLTMHVLIACVQSDIRDWRTKRDGNWVSSVFNYLPWYDDGLGAGRLLLSLAIAPPLPAHEASMFPPNW